MPRIKTGPTTRRRHKKVLKSVKGYRAAISKRYKAAKEASLHAGQYAFEGRRLRKRDMRRLWIQRINAGLSQIENGPSYSVLTHLLKTGNVELNRKMLAEIATNDFDTFKSIIAKVYGK